MMGTVIGSVGVGLLLLAFVLNLRRVLAEHSPVYLSMNIIGSGLAAVYAAVSGSVPFIVLEAVWGGAAALRLVQHIRKTRV